MSAEKIRRQHLYRSTGTFANGNHAAIEMIGTAVRQIIARDRRNNHMSQPEPKGRLSHARWFIVFEIFRFSTRYRAKPARPRANIPKDHESGSAAGIALGPVGTACVFTNRFEA